MRDHGLGISENASRKLFREFYRGDNAVNATIVGSGIGLLLVKNYVAMHGGSVSLESKENEGSLFRISIPYKEVPIISPRLTGTVTKNVSPISLASANDETSVANSQENEKNEQLLIVEDNEDLKVFLQQSLQANYKIASAKDGVEAWEMIQDKLPIWSF